jgi:transcription termination factor NusB
MGNRIIILLKQQDNVAVHKWENAIAINPAILIMREFLNEREIKYVEKYGYCSNSQYENFNLL